MQLLAIVGPTASGKTALSVALAHALSGEILSCDSMQIYRKMNIGTAKPTEEEKEGVPHHLLDIVDPCQNFSCAEYQQLAREKIAQIRARGNLPIFCGGTGLYLDSVLYDRPFDQIPSDPILRAELQKTDPDLLYAELQKIDPASAQAIHKNNQKRVQRAVEIYRLTGKTKTQWDLESQQQRPLYDLTVLGLDYRDRKTLYDRIDLRVDLMMAQGLEEEVRSLGLQENTTAAQAIGYGEFFPYFRGERSLQEVVDQIKQNSRNYAKRQLTWFRRQKPGIPPTRWIFRDELPTTQALLQAAITELNHAGFSR